MKRNRNGLRPIVTGASSGIVREIGIELTDAGAKVIAVARSATKLNEITGVAPIVADITKPDDRERVIKEAVSRLGGLDLLVNNAGIASFGRFVDSTEAINRQILKANFLAAAGQSKWAAKPASSSS